MDKRWNNMGRPSWHYCTGQGQKSKLFREHNMIPWKIENWTIYPYEYVLLLVPSSVLLWIRIFTMTPIPISSNYIYTNNSKTLTKVDESKMVSNNSSLTVWAENTWFLNPDVIRWASIICFSTVFDPWYPMKK